MNYIERLAADPMSARSADYLATAYTNGGDLETFLNAVPAGAHMLDIASGLSTFGTVVAQERPDVTFVNLDIKYQDRDLRDELQKSSPSNLVYLPGDGRALPPELSGAFDRTYSYAYMMHLMRIRDEQIRRRVGRGVVNQALDTLVDASSVFSAGPLLNNSLRGDQGSISLTIASAQGEIDQAIEDLTPSRIARRLMDASDIARVSVHSGRETNIKGKFVLFDFDKQDYAKLSSFRGIGRASKIVGALVGGRHFDDPEV